MARQILPRYLGRYYGKVLLYYGETDVPALPAGMWPLYSGFQGSDSNQRQLCFRPLRPILSYAAQEPFCLFSLSSFNPCSALSATRVPAKPAGSPE